MHKNTKKKTDKQNRMQIMSVILKFAEKSCFSQWRGKSENMRMTQMN